MTDIDLSKRSPGSFAPELLSGAPVDFFLDLMFRRVGIPLDHPVRAQLKNTHPSDMSECPRLPDVFPPDDWEKRTKSGKLQSVQDWLDLVTSVDVVTRARGEGEQSDAIVAPEAPTQEPQPREAVAIAAPPQAPAAPPSELSPVDAERAAPPSPDGTSAEQHEGDGSVPEPPEGDHAV